MDSATRGLMAAGLIVLIGTAASAQQSGISGHTPPAGKTPPVTEPYKPAMPTVDEKVMPPQSSYDSPRPTGQPGVSTGSPGSSDASRPASAK